MQLTVLWGLGSLAGLAFTVAYPGLVWAGTELAHLPLVVAYLLPAVIDAGMLTLGLAAAVKRSRRRSARLELGGLTALVIVSVVAQVTHVLTLADGSTLVGVIVGCLLAATPPIALLVAVESALRAVLSEPTRRGSKPAPRGAAPASPASETAHAKPAARAAPATRPVTSETPAVTDRQRAAAAERFASIPGYRDAVERYLREGAPTPRAIAEMPGAPAKATVQTDVRVARALVIA